MTTATIFAFLVSFGAGPILFALLVRLKVTPRVLASLGIGTIAAVVGAFAVRQSLPVPSLACLWLAWVLALSLFAVALRSRLRTLGVWRASFVAGLLATTLPWFGLAAAQMVTT